MTARHTTPTLKPAELHKLLGVAPPPRAGAGAPQGGRPVRHVNGRMNKTELLYATEQLEPRRILGEIRAYEFEAMKLRLGADWKTTYTPDFLVTMADWQLEVHEVKGGHWEDDARVKIKVAARLYPQFHFVAFRRLSAAQGGGWSAERFS